MWKNVNKYDCLQCLSVTESALLVFRLAFVVQKRFPNSEEVLIYLWFSRCDHVMDIVYYSISIALNLAVALLPALNFAWTSISGIVQWSIQATLFFLGSFQNCFMPCIKSMLAFPVWSNDAYVCSFRRRFLVRVVFMVVIIPCATVFISFNWGIRQQFLWDWNFIFTSIEVMYIRLKASIHA